MLNTFKIEVQDHTKDYSFFHFQLQGESIGKLCLVINSFLLYGKAWDLDKSIELG